MASPVARPTDKLQTYQITLIQPYEKQGSSFWIFILVTKFELVQLVVPLVIAIGAACGSTTLTRPDNAANPDKLVNDVAVVVGVLLFTLQ